MELKLKVQTYLLYKVAMYTFVKSRHVHTCEGPLHQNPVLLTDYCTFEKNYCFVMRKVVQQILSVHP